MRRVATAWEQCEKRVLSIDFAKQLMFRVDWPPVLWYFVCVSLMVPVTYALYPPTTPGYEQILRRDPIPRAACLTRGGKMGSTDRDGRMAVFLLPEFHYSLCMLYVVGLCILTFTN